MIIQTSARRMTQIDYLKCELHEILDPLPVPENIDPEWFEHLKGWVFVSFLKHYEDRYTLLRCGVPRFSDEWKNNPVFEPMEQEQKEIPLFEDPDEKIQPIVSESMFRKVFDILGMDCEKKERILSDILEVLYYIQVLQTLVSPEEFERAQKETNEQDGA